MKDTQGNNITEEEFTKDIGHGVLLPNMTTQDKTMEERLAEKVCNAVLEVTDGQVQLKPIQFLTYQDEPVGEFENLKFFIQSEIALAIDNRNREISQKLLDMVEGLLLY